MTSRIDRKDWWGLAFVSPTVAFFAVFSIFPIFFGFYLSLTSFDMLTPPIFVGGANFAALQTDRLFLKAFTNTLAFVLGGTVPVWIGSLALALVFDRAFRGRDILKAIVFSPLLPPLIVVGILWKVLLHPNGVLTSVVGWFTGGSEVHWLTQRNAGAVVDDPHQRLGNDPVLHALLACRHDGDSRGNSRGGGDRRRRPGTHLPQHRSATCCVRRRSSSRRSRRSTRSRASYFSSLPGRTRAGPPNSTLTLGLLIWKYGFQYYRMGDAAAVSVVLFVIILAITAIQLWLSRTRSQA